jgi:dTDP-4-amino-4,6-dideoxygalactose transaminase
LVGVILIAFVATCNAVKYCGADPAFVDVSPGTLGLCPESLADFLETNADYSSNGPIHKNTGRKIKTCLPMHTMGLSTQMPDILSVCDKWNIPVVEDAAEALGSFHGSQSCGTFGQLGTFSFNGNKIITTGGGGAIVTNDDVLAEKIRHLATTEKMKHEWAFEHDMLGFNYRMPGLNVALGAAQFEQLPRFLASKKELAEVYQQWGLREGVDFVSTPSGCLSNNWLNAILFENQDNRDCFLEYTNDKRVMTRPAWALMNDFSPYRSCEVYSDVNARDIQRRLVCVPSSAALVI